MVIAETTIIYGRVMAESTIIYGRVMAETTIIFYGNGRNNNYILNKKS